MPDLLADLNEQQRIVATTIHGPILVLAGAGSGKTRALTYRIAHMIQSGLAAPHEILAVTFTNKAAAEMKRRIGDLLQNPGKTPRAVSTFHSLGAQLLRQHPEVHGRPKTFSILASKDSERLIKEAMGSLGVSPKEFTPASIAQGISRAKNERITPVALLAMAKHPRQTTTATVYGKYELLLKKHEAFDFDDLLLRTVELLEATPALRAYYQSRWRFLSVDEYQDTNPLQDTLLSLLLGPEKNMCVVGDDYQAIYSWRGANVDHILKFESLHPNCTTIYLTQNYRSTPQILTAANTVIAVNTVQKHKTLWTENPLGENVNLWEFPSERYEASFVRQQIEQYKASGGSYKDCVILYRTNAQSRVFEEEFLTHRMPYSIIGGFKFYERREVKDALALLTLWLNPNSLLSFRRVADSMLAGVGPKTVTKWEELAQAQSVPILDVARAALVTKRSLAMALAVYENTDSAAMPTVAAILEHILEKSGYRKIVRQGPEGEERLENIEELLNVASTYTDPVKFLEDVALLSDIDGLEEHHDRITCMSLHAAKGLEYPIVFLVGCEEGLLPHSNSVHEQASLEEERRLLYVGMTRAKKKLYMTYATARWQRGEVLPQAPSQFLRDLPADITVERAFTPRITTAGTPSSIDPFYEEIAVAADDIGSPATTLAPQSFIVHPVFGQGVVISSQAGKATCIFEGQGIKTVATSSLQVHA